MRPLAFTLPYFVVFAAVFVWSFVAESAVVRAARAAAARGGAPDDRGSLQVVMFMQAAGFFFAFLLAWRPQWGCLHGDQRAVFWIGISIMIGASALRRLCFRTLGQSFTGEVRVRDGQRVVTSGPYRFVRHPSYTAGILMIVGVAIALGTWLGALVGTVLSAAGYAYRVSVEERALATKLGTPYHEYMLRTKRFIPFLI